MSEWFNRLREESAVIRGAPWSFAICLGVLGAVIFYADSFRYGAQIDGLKEAANAKDANLKWQSEQIADYKSKTGTNTPDEAKRRLDALELQVNALTPRRLTNDQKDKILKALGGLRGVIEIARDAAESAALTGDFALIFQSAGWDVSTPMFMGIGNIPQSGIALRVNNPASLLPNELVIKRALDAAGINYDVQPGLDQRGNAVGTRHIDAQIIVTTKLN